MDTTASLPRLPPGRHGLTREFVTQNQRDRIAAAVIAVVAEHGYEETTISQIAAAAGISRRTFYTYFPGKRDCFLAAYELIAGHLNDSATAAAAAQATWPDRVRAVFEVALETFAANPNLARFFLTAPERAEDAEILSRHRRLLAKAARNLSADAPTESRLSAALEQSLLAGLASFVIAAVDSGEEDRLLGMAPELTKLYLAPRPA